ncbi:g103 [Coccomyxa viridis]|uniref:G103 protein n=1 Tax=Coccomyxa viridis TaxID=1274662 RepID=A0ABP1FEW6_9CHLO
MPCPLINSSCRPACSRREAGVFNIQKRSEDSVKRVRTEFGHRSWKSRPVWCKASQEDQAQQERAQSKSAAQNGASHHADEASSNGNAPVELQGQDTPWRWVDSEDALRTYIVFFGILLAGELPLLKGVQYADLPYFVGLATLTIYIGAHRGLSSRNRQQLSMQQSALAPLAASAALFGGYLIIKLFPNFSLQAFFNLYFWLIGSVAVAGNVLPPLRRLGGQYGESSIDVNFPDGWFLDENGASISQAQIAPTDIAAAATGLCIATLQLLHPHWTLNNLLACLIATDILQLLGLRSFKAAAVMLFGLLAYDVFWVFGSPAVIGDNVMLAVATSDALTGPTRLLFPRFAGSIGEASRFPFSLLGLGDIAVPGLLACLALRYDASRSTDFRGRQMAAAQALQASLDASSPGASDREITHAAADAAEVAFDRVADAELAHREGTEGTSATASSSYAVSDAVLDQRTYFVPTMAAYIGGLGIAFAANAITHMGQPALLYLVPATCGAIFLVAAGRGEVGRVLSFVDTPSPAVEKALGRQKDGAQ